MKFFVSLTLLIPQPLPHIKMILFWIGISRYFAQLKVSYLIFRSLPKEMSFAHDVISNFWQNRGCFIYKTDISLAVGLQQMHSFAALLAKYKLLKSKSLTGKMIRDKAGQEIKFWLKAFNVKA